jgi:hypothetical protein
LVPSEALGVADVRPGIAVGLAHPASDLLARMADLVRYAGLVGRGVGRSGDERDE